jgi:hypothetical protein
VLRHDCFRPLSDLWVRPNVGFAQKPAVPASKSDSTGRGFVLDLNQTPSAFDRQLENIAV